ncbi:MAG: histidinol-phosphatase HisJ family protein [Ruminococcaceae bacterium]|nr:histidinol-phosphatase HisJ family protein [Oscillospiraceae bacterium]
MSESISHVPMLGANYHTHTHRCKHAAENERNYIENAIAGGVKILGFADHTPQFFDDGYYSNFRMYPEELQNYTDTLLNLREEYKGQIDILIGLEVEYYPKFFGRLIDFLKDYPMDYLILGQHFINNEFDGYQHVIHPTEDVSFIAQYTEQVCEAFETGYFAYAAHPDMCNFIADPAVYRSYSRRICEKAKELDIPLEMNFLGYTEKRCYPRMDFWEIAAEVGNTVIFGCDAHQPDMIPNNYAFRDCLAIVEKLSLNRTETIRMTMRK